MNLYNVVHFLYCNSVDANKFFLYKSDFIATNFFFSFIVKKKTLHEIGIIVIDNYVSSTI